MFERRTTCKKYFAIYRKQ